LALQRKTKPARFIDRIDFRTALLLEFGRSIEERSFRKTLRRFRVAPAFLYHHHVKILMHINPKSAHRTDPSFGGLDRASAAI
jgi:hypothetical protein